MNQLQVSSQTLQQLLERCAQSSDFVTTSINLPDQQLTISYYKTLIDEKLLQYHVILPMQDRGREEKLEQLEHIRAWVPIDDIEITYEVDTVQAKLLCGSIMIQIDKSSLPCALVNIPNMLGLRDSNDTENEFSVVGPKVGFVEDIHTNIRLIRALIKVPNLVVREITIGSLSQTKVALLYLEGVTNKQYIDTMEQRLRDIDFELVFDSSQLDEIMCDNTWTPFPLFLSTERRDRVVYALISGQVAVISDGSPYFVTGPSTLFDFFISPEDYYLPWMIGSFFRMIRIFGVFFSLFATAMYVAITTYHYEVVPKDLLGPLIYSRQNVPFSPLIEVLFLEITVEFLREAGARLPSRIGQTLGIVGGIILGQAAVEAALTSNVLIIIVALSALASFATPIYKMSNTIRFLRFPIIILAASWGGIGMFFGIGFILVHITRLTSLGSPYMLPAFPLRVTDLRDSFIRSSYQWLNRRPQYLRTGAPTRYTPKVVQRKHELDDE
ncbi:spore germination protein [Paenibacillus sp. GCM10023252]|uniref:spore germination protein n=1 Tax=Paenibacillus sp. GCM10023252 TaxID=3252649 RepID=UPI00360DB8E2